MINLKAIFFLTTLTISLNACGQNKSDHLIVGKSHAQKALKSALSGKAQHNVIDNKSIIIKDRLTAIQIAEPILFSIYGKDNIIQQRPYEAYFVDNYWVITGTLPEDYLGGTFLIIINAFNIQIIKISHGK